MNITGTATRKVFSATLLIAIIASMTGCVAAAVNTTAIAVKGAPRGELLPLAEAGDADAQYELGKSYCCMGPGFDTQTATEWYCKAARQGNTNAMYELGRVYLGDVSRSPAPGQKLRRAVSAKRDPALAYVWLSRAAAQGHTDAAEELNALGRSINDDTLEQARTLNARWPEVPCEYDNVFGN